jgi:hypothetical protein
VLLVRRIRDLLYDQGFTISGARNRLNEPGYLARGVAPPTGTADQRAEQIEPPFAEEPARDSSGAVGAPASLTTSPSARPAYTVQQVRLELQSIRELLAP